MMPELSILLLLIIIANGSPILIRVLLKDRFHVAVDFGKTLADGAPILGPSKTWRGVIAALIVTSAAAWLVGHSPQTGLLVAAYAVTGDLTSSFVKRRLAMVSSSRAPLLDQLPESLLPAWMMRDTFNLEPASVWLLVLIFVIIEIILSRILYKWGIRKKPY